MNTVNTTSSSLFFSRTFNLVSSIIINTTKPINIIVWDIGLNKIEKHILNHYKIKVVKIPEFCKFWRDCYTWKPYVFKISEERFFLHLDSGNTVLCDIDIIFQIIKEKGYFFVDQGQSLSQIAPKEYFSYFGLNPLLNYRVIAAGNIGFDKNSLELSKVIDMTYESSINGMCLGFSKKESSRASTKEFILRDCEVFRHDQTVLNCCLRSVIPEINILDYSIYSAINRTPNVKIYNHRKISYEFILKNMNFYKFIIFIYCLFNDSVFYFIMKFRKIIKRLI